MAKCAICESTFGMTLWKHTCVLCRRQVCGSCSSSSVPVSAAAVQKAEDATARDDESSRGADSDDDGTPKGEKNKASTRAGGKSKAQKDKTAKTSGGVIEARVCKVCLESGKAVGGRRLGGADETNPACAPIDANNNNNGTNNAAKPDPNSESEREKRARLIEARMNSKKAPGAASAAPAARPKPIPSQQPPASPPAAPTAPAPTSPNRPTNPALEAALRRQQQSKKNAGPEKSYSEEKKRLLREIEAIHARTGTEAPFGLKAADEVKLRSYRSHLESKYNP